LTYNLVNLPTSTWVITSLDYSARDNLCARQMNFCSTYCIDALEVLDNNYILIASFCNTTTLAFGCKCKHEMPSSLNWEWPVVVADCQGKLSECQDKCAMEADPTRGSCTYDCTSYYECGTAKSPPSYLMTNNVTDIPAYKASPTGNSQSGQPSSTLHGSPSSSPNATSGSCKRQKMDTFSVAFGFISFMSLIAHH
ncbi:hypothetical protein INT43_008120, partial [Umbelopsis isabellina]